MKKSKGLTQRQQWLYFIGLIIFVLVTYGILSFFVDVAKMGQIKIILIMTVVMYLPMTIYHIVVDIRIGVEWRIERLVGLTLVAIFSLMVVLAWDDLKQQETTLGVMNSVAPIFAGCVAMYGLTIAFLNYKRKSGVSIGCGIISGRVDTIDLYFTNFKDKAVVIYSFHIEIYNLAVKQSLKRPIILSPYGMYKYRIKKKLYQFSQKIEEGSVSGYIKDHRPLGQPLPFSINVDVVGTQVKIRAETNLGNTFIDVYPIEGLDENKEIHLSPVLKEQANIYAKKNTSELSGQDKAEIENMDRNMRNLGKVSDGSKYMIYSIKSDDIKKYRQKPH